MGSLSTAVALLTAGISGQTRFKSFIEGQSGQSVTVGTDLRNSTPPCVLVSYERGEVSGPMKTGAALFRVRAVFPLFGDALATALEAVDLLVEDIYFGVARGDKGVRMGGGVAIQSVSEIADNPGMWDAVITVEFDF